MEEYIVDKLTNSSLASTNCVYVKSKKSDYIKIWSDTNNSIFKVCDDTSLDSNIICMNTLQRTHLGIILGKKVKIQYVDCDILEVIEELTFVVKKISGKINFDITDEIVEDIRLNLYEIPISNEMILSYKNKISLHPIEINNSSTSIYSNKKISPSTKFKFISTDKNINIDIDIDISQEKELFKSNFNFIEMGIGGLDKQFEVVFRRAFSSRLLPDKILKNLGINHVRGLILYGLPGCGKTIIARQIGKILNCEEPKIVSGPSLLSSYQGQSEKNVRDLFDGAYADKSNKKLHLIILDEFDAISRKRGTLNDSGLSDRLVNQLLSMIDGPESLNNILLIAMTNRLELIDDALLRPGRFEVQIEIGLPDEKGRYDILTIHTNKMAKAGYLNGVDLHEIANITQNFTGAELESVVKNAVSYCISKDIDPNNLSLIKDINPRITQNEIIRSVKEIKPQFGTISTEIDIITNYDFDIYSSNYNKTYLNILDKIKNLKKGNLITFMIQGDSYIGKTTLACHIAKKSELSCIKFVNSEKLLNCIHKEQQLYDIFEQGYKTESFVLILDSVEKIIEYSKLGHIYNNKLLQTIYALLAKIIDTTKKIIIILTSSNTELMEQLDFNNICNYSYILSDEFISEHNTNISEYFKSKKFI
jgi:SpoVK/Ycf46/Vps4 family AAA+-type ATPase